MATTNRNTDTALATTALTDCYTVPSGFSAVVSGIRLTSKGGSEVGVTVKVYDSSGAVTYEIEEAHLGKGSEEDNVGAGLILEDGDKIKVQASKANVVDVVCSVVETDGQAAVDFYQATVPAVGTAGNDDANPVHRVRYAGVISSVTYIPKTTITGANTQTRKVGIINKGAGAAGAAVPANLQFDSGVNATAFIEKTITLDATPSNLAVAAGDVLDWFSTHLGTGITDPGGLIRIGITRS